MRIGRPARSNPASAKAGEKKREARVGGKYQYIEVVGFGMQKSECRMQNENGSIPGSCLHFAFCIHHSAFSFFVLHSAFILLHLFLHFIVAARLARNPLSVTSSGSPVFIRTKSMCMPRQI